MIKIAPSILSADFAALGDAIRAVECGRRPGLHAWKEVSFCEVLDPDGLRPVPPGEVGVLCVTPVAGGNALPFVR